MNGAGARLRRLVALRPADARAAIWASRSLTKVRADLVTDGSKATVTPPPAGLPASGLPIVRTVLNKRHATCLERSLVLQRWLADHGRPTTIVIGVGKEGDEFAAHAWLPGFDKKRESIGFTEISRIEP